MRKSTTIFIFVLSVTFFHQHVSAQENKPETWFSKHPVDFAFGVVSVGMPFTGFLNPPSSPFISTGTEFYYKQKEHYDFYQTVRLNYYHAEYSTSGMVVNSEAGFRYTFNSGLFADAALGIGYAHLFRPKAVFQQNNKGEYEQERDWGTPRFMADFFLSAGYDFSRTGDLSLSIYLKYGNYMDLLYAPDIPALPHNIFQIGARYYFLKEI